MNLASLTQLSAADPLPLRLGPRCQPPAPEPARALTRVVGDHLVSQAPDGKLSCRPIDDARCRTQSDKRGEFKQLYGGRPKIDFAAVEAQVAIAPPRRRVAQPGECFAREVIEDGAVEPPPGFRFVGLDGAMRGLFQCTRGY